MKKQSSKTNIQLLKTLGWALIAGLSVGWLSAYFSVGVSFVAWGIVAAFTVIFLLNYWKKTEKNLDLQPKNRIENADRYQRVLEYLPNPVLVINAQGEVVFANQAGLTAFDHEQAIGNFSFWIRDPEFADAVSETLLAGQNQAVEVALHGAVTQTFIAQICRYKDGDAFAVLVVFEDQTKIRRSEETHIDFVANASHELRTPLQSLSGFVETLRGNAKHDPEATDRFLAIMETQIARMTRLVQDLMSLSRIELNEHVPPLESMRIDLLIDEVLAALAPVAQESGAEINRISWEEKLFARGARDELVQLFTNLIDNAIKYGSSEKPIEIRVLRASSRPGFFGICIEDFGQGVERRHIQRLTERFYRVDNAISRSKGGTGLGLAIAKHVVNRHMGDLVIESAIGQGSRFTVWLPEMLHMVEHITGSNTK